MVSCLLWLDLIAQEAKYYRKCLAGLYNRKRVASCPTSAESDSPAIHGLVLAELLSYIQDIRANTSVTAVFKMAYLVKQYSARLTQYGYSCDTRLNSTLLCDRLLFHFPDIMQARQDGRDIYLQ